MKYIKALIEDGEIKLRNVGTLEWAPLLRKETTRSQCLRDATLKTSALCLRGWDRAVAKFYETGETTDEINLPSD